MSICPGPVDHHHRVRRRLDHLAETPLLSRSASSAALRYVISTIADSTIVPSSVSIGFKPISTGNSLPSFLTP